MAVRRESVEIRVDSNLASVATRDAAAVALLRRELDSVNGHPLFQANSRGQLVQINQQANSASQSLGGLQQQSGRADASLRQTDRSINQLTGRLGLFADAVTILGPGLVPIAAVGATAIGGLAVAATAATTAAAAAVVAFQGVGDAVKASNEYAIDPTAENLAKLQVAMKAIGPDAQSFVRNFQAFIPTLTAVRDAAAAGLFPGLTESLTSFEKMGPRVAEILNLVGSELGDIVADSAESFAGPRWVGFMGFLRDELPDALRSVSKIMGDLGHGAAVLMQRLDPGNDSFLGWLEDVADGFDKWATSSEGRDDIRDFLEYARENGPEVADLFGSLTKALAAIVTAAAPLGGPVLQGLTAIADLIATIAESDAATPLLAAYSAFRLYTRGATLAAAAQARLNATQRVGPGGSATSAANLRALNSAGLTGTALGGALIAPRPGDLAAQQRATRLARLSAGAQGAAFAGMIAMSATPLGDLTEKAGASNAAMGALLGTMIAPGWGTAAGAIGGSILDLVSANDDLTKSLDDANQALDSNDLTAAAKNLAAARKELAKYREEQDIGKYDAPSFGAGLQNIKDDFKTMFGGKSDGDVAEERIKQLEDYYRAQYQLTKLKPVSNYAGFNDLFGDLTGVITPTTNALNDFVGAMKSANDFLGYRANLVSYEEAWDNIRASIKENGRTLDETGEKGRANIQALDGLANTGIKFAESLTGTKRGTFLRRLARDIREAAGEFKMSKAEVDAYLEQLGLLDRKEVKPKVDLDTDTVDAKTQATMDSLAALGDAQANPVANLYTGPFDVAAAGVVSDLFALDSTTANPFIDIYKGPFDAGLAGAESDLAAFNGSHATAYLDVVRRTRSDNEIGRHGGAADGTTVPKTGRPYADRHLYLLADGEEVISNRNGQADRHRSLLKAINAGRLADGGTTGGDTVTPMAAPQLKSAIRENAAALKEFKSSLKAATAALDKERQKREDFKAYRSEVAGSLGTELTGNGLAGLRAGLSANRSDARSALFALKKAKRNGLDGPLFDLIASSGDLNLIQQAAALSKSETARLERQYGASTSAQNALGNFASQEKFDATLGGINKTIRSLNATVSRLGKEVERGAERGTRLGNASKSRNASTGTRAGR